MAKKRRLVNAFLFAGLIFGIVRPEWASPSDLKEFVFPEVAGWKRSGEIQTFSPKTLYEYIDGAADLYLMYDFQALKVAEYQNEKKSSVTVDVYFHKTPIHASESTVRSVFPTRTSLTLGLRRMLKAMPLTF